MANHRSHFVQFCCCYISSWVTPARSSRETGPRRKSSSELKFDALSMILEPRRQVNVGLPYGSNGILHLEGNLTESTVVGLRAGSLANKGVLSVLLALRPSLSVPHCHFKQYFHQRGCLSLFRSNSNHSSNLCHVSLLQLGQYFPGSLPGTSTRLLPS